MENTELKQKFAELYGEGEIRLFAAAGRVNLIGEHIDYCGGKVFPAALNLCCTVAARKNNEKKIRLAATTIEDKVTLDLGKLDSYRDLPWGAYQAGVAYIMAQEGYEIVGCDLLFDCTVPFGSGLSSSAAIEVATAKTLAVFSEEAGGKSADNPTLAILSQKAENEYTNVACGIMDQYASACGKQHRAMLLDCKTLECSYVPLDFGEYTLVIANSNKRRSLQEGKYNERRAECEEALAILQKSLPEATCLADITPKDFKKASKALSPVLLKRARHVVTECARVKEAAEALEKGKVKAFGKLLNESHFSLRDDYEVTGKELDALTEYSRNFKGCIGSRMTGAGFGGCTVSLVKTELVPAFIDTVGKAYESAVGYAADFYTTTIEDGAREVL
ncbi:MAG: galactokinase [Clostridiales bacterium]|nr:galactokinase [Clostridiales bacterium]